MSGLFGGNKGVNSQAPVVASLRWQTSAYGKAIALAYGKPRLPGNLIWYDDFTAISHSTSQGGGKGGSSVSNTNYTYTVAAAMGLCEGPITGVWNVWASQAQVSAASVGMSCFTGTASQTAYGYITTNHPGYDIAYRRTAYMAVSAYDLGDSGSMPNHTFETQALLQFGPVGTGNTITLDPSSSTVNCMAHGWSAGQCIRLTTTGTLPTELATGVDYVAVVVTANTFQLAYNASLSGEQNSSSPGTPTIVTFSTAGTGTITATACIPDALIPAVLQDYLTDAYHGVSPSFPLGSLTAATDYCQASGLFISAAWTEQEQASDVVTRICEIGNLAPVYSEGVLKIIPYGDTAISGNGATYTPVNTVQYALTDDDFIDGGSDAVVTARNNTADAFNCFQVQFYDRALQYNQSIAEAKDQANIELLGLRTMQPISYDEIADATVARAVAQLRLQRILYLRNTYKFTLGWRYCLLEPMDIVTLTESTMSGLSGVPVRITSIEENDDGTLAFEAEDFPGTVSSHVAYPMQKPGGYTINYEAPPGSVQPPIIFDAPGRMTAAGYEIWLAIAGQNSMLWGGCNVWVSTDGSSYKSVGTVKGPARYGSLTATFGSGTDPDTTNTCAVDLTISNGTLTSGTAADADNLNTLCLCDGELFSYQTATLTGANKYTLQTRLRRGVYGTPIASHAAGKGFVRLDDALFAYAYDPAMIGKTIYFKFTSFNIYGAGYEDISTVATYSYTISGPIGAPADVAGATATATADGVILLSWGASASPNIKQFEVRKVDANWGVNDADFVGTSLTTLLKVPALTSVGTTTWYVKGIDTSGRYSTNATSMSLTVAAPSAPAVTQQVIDNNVMLFWTAAVGTQVTKTYEIRRGTTWAGATVVGNKSGLFTTILETAAGTYTYWVAAIDAGGIYGTATPVAATVSQPPDYTLKSNVQSTFSGTLTNAVLDAGSVYAPVDMSTSFQNHFTSHSWSTPQDQINAGYSVYAEPTLTSGSYSETVDYGQTLAGCRVSVAYSGAAVAGSPGVTTDILLSPDNSTWTTYTNASQVFGTNFRYAKVRVNFTGGAGGTDLYRLDALSIRLDVKLINDAGNGTVSSAANGLVVNFNMKFLALTAITLSPQNNGGTAVVPIYDFHNSVDSGTYSVTSNVATINVTSHSLVAGMNVDLMFSSGTAPSGVYQVASVVNANSYTVAITTANTSGNLQTYPEGMVVYLFNSAGTKITGPFSWASKGN